MHLWKEIEFSNSNLKNMIFKCFPYVIKHSPKNERENLQKIIQGNATSAEKNNSKIEIVENISEKIDQDESRKLM